jgi:hypothetical protein
MRFQDIESFVGSNGFDRALEVEESCKMRGLCSEIISYSLVMIDKRVPRCYFQQISCSIRMGTMVSLYGDSNHLLVFAIGFRLIPHLICNLSVSI